MTKEQKEAIEKIDKKLDTTEDEEITVNLLYKKIDLLEDMLKQNSAEIAEIEKYKSLYNKALEDLAKTNRKNIENKKVIDLMVKAINKIQDPQLCKYCDNNINLNNEYCTDAKKCKEGIKKYFERKAKNEN